MLEVPSSQLPQIGPNYYNKISVLCNEDFSNEILKSINRKLSVSACNTPPNLVLMEEKALLLRRLGRLQESHDVYESIYEIKKEVDKQDSVINVQSGDGLKWHGNDSFLPAPFLKCEHMLPPDELEELWQYTLQHERKFRAATVGVDEGLKLDEEKRKTLVLTEIEKFRPFITEIIYQKIPILKQIFNITEINPTHIDLKITNHLDKYFFHIHKDDISHSLRNDRRIVSFILFFYKQPKAFDGGDLLLFDTDKKKQSYKISNFTRIACENNTMIFFPSEFFHCIDPVRLANNCFEYGRFALSGHLHVLRDRVKHE